MNRCDERVSSLVKKRNAKGFFPLHVARSWQRVSRPETEGHYLTRPEHDARLRGRMSTQAVSRREFCERRRVPATGADMTSRFRSGETVRLSSLLHKSAAGGEYKIVRPLPETSGEQQYRIKSEREPHDRVVKESDLEKV